jgi:hypothetical protein
MRRIPKERHRAGAPDREGVPVEQLVGAQLLSGRVAFVIARSTPSKPCVIVATKAEGSARSARRASSSRATVSPSRGAWLGRLAGPGVLPVLCPRSGARSRQTRQSAHPGDGPSTRVAATPTPDGLPCPDPGLSWLERSGWRDTPLRSRSPRADGDVEPARSTIQRGEKPRFPNYVRGLPPVTALSRDVVVARVAPTISGTSSSRESLARGDQGPAVVSGNRPDRPRGRCEACRLR